MASAMAAMSRAILETIQRYAPTLGELEDEPLMEFHSIVTAFSFDLRAELERRGIELKS